MRPWLWFLTRTSDCRIFQEMTVPDIVKKVFDDHASVAHVKLKLFRSYHTWTYCVQHRESDFSFIARLLARHLPLPQHQFVMLDAGRGTGLCGPLMAPWARMPAGVDLSKGMPDRAQTKGVYSKLYKAELTEFLQLSPRQWDVVLSADTLVFTVEALPDEAELAHQIQPHGRYAHHERHIIEVLSAAGLSLLDMEGVILREEDGKPVNRCLVAARQLARLSEAQASAPSSTVAVTL